MLSSHGHIKPLQSMISRNWIRNTALIFIACFSLSVSSAVADPLSDDQTESILKELDRINDFIHDNRVSLRTQAVKTFEDAASSDNAAYSFYLKCHKILKFDASVL